MNDATQVFNPCHKRLYYPSVKLTKRRSRRISEASDNSDDEAKKEKNVQPSFSRGETQRLIPKYPCR